MQRAFNFLAGMMVRGSCAVLVVACLAGTAYAQQQAHEYNSDQIQAGYRLYVDQCQNCHGAYGDNIGKVNLSRQQFDTAHTDDDIRHVITTGNAAGMPPFIFKSDELDDLIAYIRSGMDRSGVRFRLGDAGRGKAVYDKAGCAQCHRIAGVGPLTAPDLTDIGFIRRPAQLMVTLTDPSKAMLPINRPVIIVMKDGRTIRGRRYDEDTLSVRLIDSQGQMLSIQKSDISRYDFGTASMPSYKDKLTDDEISDLLAYLVSLKG